MIDNATRASDYFVTMAKPANTYVSLRLNQTELVQLADIMSHLTTVYRSNGLMRPATQSDALRAAIQRTHAALKTRAQTGKVR